MRLMQPHDDGGDPVGIPYAEAGQRLDDRRHLVCTATCPVCGHVAEGATSKKAAKAYANHFAEQQEAERAEAGA